MKTPESLPRIMCVYVYVCVCVYNFVFYRKVHIAIIFIKVSKDLSLFSREVMSDSCHPMDCSLPGSSVHGILQVRTLEWVPFPSPGGLPDPGIEPESPLLQADSLLTEL